MGVVRRTHWVARSSLGALSGASPGIPGRAASGSLFAHPWRDGVAALCIADAWRVPAGTCLTACRSLAVGSGAACCSLHRITAFAPSRTARAGTLAAWRAVFDP